MPEPIQAITVLELIALSLPAAAIFYQVMIKVAEDSPKSPLYIQGIYIPMLFSLLFLVTATALAVWKLWKQAQSPILFYSVILVTLSLASLLLAGIFGYLANTERYRTWIDEELGEGVNELRSELDEIESKFDQIKRNVKDQSASPEDISYFEESFVTEKEISEFETVEEYIAAEKEAVRDKKDKLDTSAEEIQELRQEADILSATLKPSRSGITYTLRHPIKSFRENENIRLRLAILFGGAVGFSYGKISILVTGLLVAIGLLLLYSVKYREL